MTDLWFLTSYKEKVDLESAIHYLSYDELIIISYNIERLPGIIQVELNTRENKDREKYEKSMHNKEKAK